MRNSIKRFLLIYITLSILVIYALISFASYWVSKEELDELYDANLQQYAHAVAAQHINIEDETSLYQNNQVGAEKDIEGEQEFFLRVLAEDGRVLYVSHPNTKLPVPTTMGLSTEKIENKQWRFFALKAKNRTIQVAQSLKLRKTTIKETAYSLMVSQLAFIPLLVLLIFYAIRKALSPLSMLSKQIQHRDSYDLNPFADDNVPAEVRPLVQSLNMFMGKVSFMVDVLKRFTSDAAHELRTPITGLKLQLTALEQSNSKSERECAIRNLKSGIARSEQLVSQLLTLARIDPDNKSRHIQSLNMLELVKESFQELLPLAQEKSIDIGLMKADDCEINASRQEIKVLINNILDNAIRYTPNGGKIDVSVISQAGNVNLEVKDSGPGIPQHELERVFERFYRGENQHIPGSGLGLAIVKEIAIQHKAIIQLSNNNPGLSFKVIFTRKSLS
jgi:two-component system OmpR family sensor kinase